MTWLPIVHRRLLRGGLAATRSWLKRRPQGIGGDPGVPKAMAYAIDVAARHGLSAGTCLSRSLLLEAWLRRAGHDPALRIGVRKDGADTYAHAWIELDGRVVNDQADINRRYAVLNDQRRTQGSDGGLGDARIE